MRGIPGSGKSYTAKELVKNNEGVVFSTDEFFMVNETYKFNPKLIGKAHKWNQTRVETAMLENISNIVVDNTNTQHWEYEVYQTMAKKHGYDVKITYPTSSWWLDMQERIFNKSFTEDDINILEKKNTHGVPKDSIKKMMARFEK